MGTDLYLFTEVKTNNLWLESEHNLQIGNFRSYNISSFLAGIRNYNNIIPICNPKGFPIDSEYLNAPYNKDISIREDIMQDGNYDGESWLMLKEMLDFNYEQTFEINHLTIEREWDKKNKHWNKTEHITTEQTNYREFLGEAYYEDIELLKTLGKPEDVRIIFYFG